jgi:nitrate/TMAO reductase-like tetraheme cytochrome c subunit
MINFIFRLICKMRGHHRWECGSPKAGLYVCEVCGKELRIYPNYMCSSRYSEDGGATFKCDQGQAPHGVCDMSRANCPKAKSDWIQELEKDTTWYYAGRG